MALLALAPAAAEICIASQYGDGYHGKRTASGAIFNTYARSLYGRNAQAAAPSKIGAAVRDRADPAQARQHRRWQSASGRHPHRGVDRRSAAVEAACAETVAHGVHRSMSFSTYCLLA
jgi:hypothetical protein